ncbi:MAG: hypothetical protein AUG51_03045 [Acidobacteria bacterium 13_1_20CM_3_53_8]|nr:MAG: hypothetical protein AUG51_03045 [Acidobacteria bacterium 13_1_20CM_3_53_8]
MAKTLNTSGSNTIRVTLSHQSIRLLDSLAEKGIYGRNRAEVAGRFIDEALQKFVETPHLQLQKQPSDKK